MVIAAYIEQLSGALSPASVKQHLAALRMLFDWLVVGQVLPFNPAQAGNTLTPAPTCASSPVHPRAGGEHAMEPGMRKAH